MHLIVGLGNPGPAYAATRHNMGSRIVHAFRERFDFPSFKRNTYMNALIAEGNVDDQRVMLLLPQTYMNRSGEAVRQVVQRAAKMPELIVVQDELDLPLGKMKISHGRGAGGHHGIESIMQHMGGTDFVRLRIGISPSMGKGKDEASSHKQMEEGQDFVLGNFDAGEELEVARVVKEAIEALVMVVHEGWSAAAQQFNMRTNADRSVTRKKELVKQKTK